MQTNLIDIYDFCCGIRQAMPNFVYHLSPFARERGASKDGEKIHQKQRLHRGTFESIVGENNRKEIKQVKQA